MRRREPLLLPNAKAIRAAMHDRGWTADDVAQRTGEKRYGGKSKPVVSAAYIKKAIAEHPPKMGLSMILGIARAFDNMAPQGVTDPTCWHLLPEPSPVDSGGVGQGKQARRNPRSILIGCAFLIFVGLLLAVGASYPFWRGPGTDRQNQDTAASHYEKGLGHYHAGEWDKGIDEFNAAIQRDRENADYHHLKGIALARKGKFREAIGPIDEAIRLNPNLFGVYTNKGWVLRELGDLPGALASVNVVIEQLKPADIHVADAYHNRGDIY